MNQLIVNLEWTKKLQFSGYTAGVPEKVKFDVPDPLLGGEGVYQSPKQIFLESMAACSAIDVLSILEKMHAVMPESFSMEITGTLTQEHPKVFSSVLFVYQVTGQTPADKLTRAVALSQERYCGLSIMMKKVCDFSYAVFLEGEKIAEGNQRSDNFEILKHMPVG